MRWKGSRQSGNVQDRTGSSGGGLGGGLGGGFSGGGGGKKIAGGGCGMLVIVLLMLFMGGGNLGGLTDVFNTDSNIQPTSYETRNVNDSASEDRKEFSAVVFAHLEDYWGEVFQKRQESYTDPQLILYSGAVQSACGYASSQVGPFYCPGDQSVYLDLSFADDLANTYGATGDFALAYVLAHEVGHHVQNELGITSQLDQIRQRVSDTEYNKYSVRLELQADYLAGCFAKYLEGETYNGQPILEAGDIEEAIDAANAIGDDTLQKENQGYVVPDSFTHGTSAQRVSWFKRGYQYGDLKHGDTFNETDLDL